jgi:hypothetical protein
MQISNADRKTLAVRVPKKYQFLVKAFVCWLKIYPDKAKLWNAEVSIQEQYEKQTATPTSDKFTRPVAEAMKVVLNQLGQN